MNMSIKITKPLFKSLGEYLEDNSSDYRLEDLIIDSFLRLRKSTESDKNVILKVSSNKQ